MGYGETLIAAGLLLMALTMKRPGWLGGPQRRFVAEETLSAMISRAAIRSLGCYLVYAGAPLWVFGI